MILKTPTIKDNYHRKSWFTRSAREGWMRLLNEYSSTGKEVLLPSYIGFSPNEGSGIFDPITSSGVKYDFYLLNEELHIDYHNLESRLATRRFGMILLVHYFGYKIPSIEKIVSLCRKYDLIVVEDCAHLFSYQTPVLSDAGSFGDYSFFSLHKHFPLSDGGLLLENNRRLNLDFDDHHHYSARIGQYDFYSIAAKRRSNSRLYEKLLSDVDGITPMRITGDADVPNTFPVLIKDGLRENLYFWLLDQGYPLLALYYQLIDPLYNNRFHEMHRISKNILNLPTHQDTTELDIHNLVLKMQEGLAKLN